MTAVVAATIERCRLPFVRPIRTAGGTWREVTLALVRLSDGDGRTGFGEATDLVGAPAADAALLTRLVAGLEVLRPASIELRRSRLATDARIGPALAAGVASAAWDLRARVEARPLSATLAGDRRLTATAIAVNGLIDAAPPVLAGEAAARAAAAGYGALKVKVGDESAAAALARVRSVRDAVGPAVELRVDANGAIGLGELPAFLAGLEPVAPAYVEDPLPSSLDLAAAAMLRRASPVPFAVDAAVRDRSSAGRIIDAGAADVLVLKPSRLGGLGVARAIAGDAAGAGVDVVISTWFESGIGLAGALHLAASLPGPERAHGLGTAELLASDLLRRPLVPDGGRLTVPTGPGLGVELDDDALARFAA